MKTIYNPPSVCIGIPALNEGKNIGALLESLLAQHDHSCIIEKIIVVSDGSTDNTAHVVRSFADPRIFLIEGTERKGKAIRQNEMIEHCASDILVFLDSDIKITSDDFICKLVGPIVEERADFSSGGIAPLKPHGLVDGALAHIMRVKTYVYSRINYGDTVYACYGPARAFSRKAYSLLKFKSLVAEDAYSYLQMKQAGMRFASVAHAQFFVRVPTTIADHKKQSIRFLNSHKELAQIFGERFVSEEYAIPFNVQIQGVLYAIFSSPVLATIYVALFVYMKILSTFSGKPNVLWERALTSQEI